jgi:hypothetical protein
MIFSSSKFWGRVNPGKLDKKVEINPSLASSFLTGVNSVLTGMIGISIFG